MGKSCHTHVTFFQGSRHFVHCFANFYHLVKLKVFLLQLEGVLPSSAPVCGLYTNRAKEVSSGFLANEPPAGCMAKTAPELVEF